MNDLQTKQGIEAALKKFSAPPLAHAATALFESLGYVSSKRLKLSTNTREQFLAHFAQGKSLNDKVVLPNEWKSIDFLYQLTDDEIRAASDQQFLFDSKGAYNGAVIESYLFFALDLKGSHYTRSALAGITRELNKLFAMPALVLFRYGDTLTLAVIDRRLHKRDTAKDVLEKVTLIKDIRYGSPHRAHIEILADLSLDALRQKHGFTNFVELHRAWQKTLDSSELNKRFFLEIANWYFWALKHIEFPKDALKEADGHDHISVIRLITRLIFCWFIKEKGLLPDALFDPNKLSHTLKNFAPEDTLDAASAFYRAILQNLFFATLNTEMDQRGWTKDEQNFMAHSLYRSRELFHDLAQALDLFKNIPFLNGGLFECLDRTEGTPEKPRYVRIDGFSRRADSQPVVPDFLFFGPEREVDLSADYGEAKFKRVKVRGLIHIFDHYKFTVAENTPIEEEIALDPELSGKVFENLLAAYNPETGATARKSTGSFYTPREIVDYMVSEALIACLKTKLEATSPAAVNAGPRLRHLFAYNDEPHRFSAPEVDLIIRAIDRLRSLDPAVGSGAFPMGILHKLVFILGRLDPRNEKWKERQIDRVREAIAAAEKIEDSTIRERTRRDLEQQIAAVDDAFAHNELDYGRKLYLIENCIYGVDLQPIAVQIAKMRFFISLIVDQKVDSAATNLGVRPLPNLETKFVAANTLLGVEKRLVQFELGTDSGEAVLEIDRCKVELARVRHEYFNARTPRAKAKWRERDVTLRVRMAELLADGAYSQQQARKLAAWDPYDQNACAGFFDPEWMFGLIDGFDLVIGNPPYITFKGKQRVQVDPKLVETYENLFLDSAEYKINSFALFTERGLRLLSRTGVLAYILPSTLLQNEYLRKIRRFILLNHSLDQIVSFENRVFEAITDSILIFVSRKSGTSSATQVLRKANLTFDGTDRFISFDPVVWLDAPGSVINIRATDGAESVFEKIAALGKPLETFLEAKIGIKRAEAPIRRQAGDKYKPFLLGRDMCRYGIVFPDTHILFDTSLFHTTVDEDIFLQSQKILVRKTGNSIVAALDEYQFYTDQTIYNLYPKEGPAVDLHGVLAQLNCKLLGFYFSKVCVTNADVYPYIKGIHLKQLPMLFDGLDKVSLLARRILDKKGKNPNADTRAQEAEIDRHVYALYGLTPEEIAIVEGTAK